MKRFRSIAKSVYAEQYNGKDKPALGGKAVTGKVRHAVKTRHGKVKLEKGDWIVSNSGSSQPADLEVFSHEQFELNFERLR